MRRAVALFLLVAFVQGACAYRGGSPVATRTRLGHGTAIFDTDEGPVLIDVEIAATEPARQRGLMFRKSLPDDYGMAFLFFKETSLGFYMKNTLVPLSIAFFDEDGAILEMLDMDPCTREPCKLYTPHKPYFGAIEAAQGAFDRWGVSVGDKVSISQ